MRRSARGRAVAGLLALAISTLGGARAARAIEVPDELLGHFPWPPPWELVEPEGPPPVVHLLTFEPGDALFSAFAHSGVLVERPGTVPVAFNFGATDFADPLLALKVVRGATPFWLYGEPLEETLKVYGLHDRTILSERLRLTPAQAQYVALALEVHVDVTNSYYVYDHFSDNCATRPRDIIDAAIGGRAKAVLSEMPAGTTYRALLRDALLPHAAARLGIDLILGGHGDRPLNLWDASFLPLVLRDGLSRVEVPRPGGGRWSLLEPPVRRYVRRAEPPPEAMDLVVAGPWTLASLFALLLLAAFVAPPRPFGAVVAPAALLFGLLGGALWLVSSITVNPELRDNALILWILPLDAWLVVPAASMALGGRIGVRWARVYTAARLGMLLLLGFGHIAGLLERSIWQYAWMMILWMALATVVFHRYLRPTSGPGVSFRPAQEDASGEAT